MERACYCQLIHESFPSPLPQDNIWPDVELSPEEFESAYIEFSVYARRSAPGIAVVWYFLERISQGEVSPTPSNHSSGSSWSNIYVQIVIKKINIYIYRYIIKP